MAKLIKVIRCKRCPKFEHDPQGEVELWGLNVCWHSGHPGIDDSCPELPVILYHDTDSSVDERCPLDDA